MLLWLWALGCGMQLQVEGGEERRAHLHCCGALLPEPEYTFTCALCLINNADSLLIMKYVIVITAAASLSSAK